VPSHHPTARRRPRVLMYSHDSFGLGHLRRCREIAHSLVDAEDGLSVLIISGSPIIGSFAFRTRVDFVRVPGVVKLRDGDYTPLSLHMDIHQTLTIRESIIRHTAESFAPDICIVDKEPTGLRGEMLQTLKDLGQAGCHRILGLRDVMDDPDRLRPEWQRKGVLPALRDLYEEIWIYGIQDLHEPLAGVVKPDDPIMRKAVYTGYLRRNVPSQVPATVRVPDSPYILITTGGGGDGEELVDRVLDAYELDQAGILPGLIVTGPFMSTDRQAAFADRAERLDRVELITFEAFPEALMAQAAGVVAMGGYNTFCEILSFDRPAIIMPREEPRKEQFIRASRAEQLGLIRMLRFADARQPEQMLAALQRLPNQPRPGEQATGPLLGGLERISERTREILNARAHRGPVAASR